MGDSAADLQTYLVEAYLPVVDQSRASDLLDRLQEASAALRDAGSTITFEIGLRVPADEFAFFLFRSIGLDSVAEACARAGVRVDRIVESELFEAVDPKPRARR